MRTLYISRHAEAEHTFETDFARRLTSYGEEEAHWLGQYLAKHHVEPDIILASSAARALATSKIIMQQIHFTQDKLLVIPELYNAELETLLQYIHTLGNDFISPLIVGHNPGLSDLVHYLSDADVGNLPTCGVCGLDFDIDSWNEVYQGLGHLSLMGYPDSI